MLGGSPLEHIEDRKGILECVQRRLAWARLAAHDDRLLRDELGNAEPKQFERDEVGEEPKTMLLLLLLLLNPKMS